MRIRALVEMDLGRIGLCLSNPFLASSQGLKSLSSNPGPLFKDKTDLFRGEDILLKRSFSDRVKAKNPAKKTCRKGSRPASSIASETVRYLRERVE